MSSPCLLTDIEWHRNQIDSWHRKHLETSMKLRSPRLLFEGITKFGHKFLSTNDFTRTAWFSEVKTWPWIPWIAPHSAHHHPDHSRPDRSDRSNWTYRYILNIFEHIKLIEVIELGLKIVRRNSENMWRLLDVKHARGSMFWNRCTGQSYFGRNSPCIPGKVHCMLCDYLSKETRGWATLPLQIRQADLKVFDRINILVADTTLYDIHQQILSNIHTARWCCSQLSQCVCILIIDVGDEVK